MRIAKSSSHKVRAIDWKMAKDDWCTACKLITPESYVVSPFSNPGDKNPIGQKIVAIMRMSDCFPPTVEVWLDPLVYILTVLAPAPPQHRYIVSLPWETEMTFSLPLEFFGISLHAFGPKLMLSPFNSIVWTYCGVKTHSFWDDFTWIWNKNEV